MILHKKKSQGMNSGNRFLISVTVVGSAGPIRFVVKEEELVADVMDTALKSYAREGRLPVLGSDLNDFFLYCPNAFDNSGALSPWETIGSVGARNFLLCRKTPAMKEAEANDNNNSNDNKDLQRRGGGRWKSWFNKSLSLKIPSH